MNKSADLNLTKAQIAKEQIQESSNAPPIVLLPPTHLASTPPFLPFPSPPLSTPLLSPYFPSFLPSFLLRSLFIPTLSQP
jgi:hypothetical protein